jgi:hypothetical protein
VSSFTPGSDRHPDAAASVNPVAVSLAADSLWALFSHAEVPDSFRKGTESSV